MSRILAIDPGKKGGLVVLDGLDVVHQCRADGPHGYHQHAAKQDPDAAAMAHALEVARFTGRIDFAVLEAPAWHAIGGQGKRYQMAPSSAGRSGIEHGIWRAMLTVHGIPFEVQRPQDWRKLARIVVPKDGDPKAATIAKVAAMLPGLDLYPGQCRNPHDGLADAGGMCLAGRVVLGGPRG